MAEIGRLIRETNPPVGENEGLYPQHEAIDGSFVKTGENNPLPANISNAEIIGIKAEVTALINRFNTDITVDQASLLSKIDELNLKIDNLTEDGLFQVRNRSNTITDVLFSSNLTPNQATLFNLDAYASTVSFAIRCQTPSDFTLEIGYRADGTSNVLLKDYEVIVNELGVERNVFKFNVDFPHMRMRLRNTGLTNMDVEYAQVSYL